MAKASKRPKTPPDVKRTSALVGLVLPALLVGIVAVSYWIKIRPPMSAVSGEESADQLLAQGIRAHGAGALDQALVLYRKVLERDPANAFAHYNTAQILNDRGRYPEAEAEYGAALKAKADFVDARVNLGVVQYRQKQFPAAAATFRDALKLSPRHAQALFDLGITLYELGETDQAMARLNDALRENPKQPAAHYYLGRAHARQGELGQARAAFERTVALDGGYGPAYFELAKLYRAAGEGRRADDAEAKAAALAKNPK